MDQDRSGIIGSPEEMDDAPFARLGSSGTCAIICLYPFTIAVGPNHLKYGTRTNRFVAGTGSPSSSEYFESRSLDLESPSGELPELLSLTFMVAKSALVGVGFVKSPEFNSGMLSLLCASSTSFLIASPLSCR